MLYVKLSVEYPQDDEVIEAGPMAELLFIRGLCFAKRKLTDGVISHRQLPLVAAGIPKPTTHARTLTDVGLWVDQGDAWFIRDWFDWNPSRSDLAEKAEAKRRAGIIGAHNKHHVGEGKEPSPTCPICNGEEP